jgi:hypothetical protein
MPLPEIEFLIVLQLVKNPPTFMESEGSLAGSEESAELLSASKAGLSSMK